MVITVEFFPFPLLVGLVILAVLLARLRRCGFGLRYLIIFTLFTAYLLMVLNLVFFPIYIRADWPKSLTAEHYDWIAYTINVIPFYYRPVYDIDSENILREIAGNILLTVPFGFGLPFLVRLTARRMLLLALAAGFALEGTQLVLALLGLYGLHRSVDINDVILNALGVLLGYGGCCLAAWLVSRLRQAAGL